MSALLGIIAGFALLLALLAAAPALVVLVEVLAARRPARAAAPAMPALPGRIAILMPAHNEEGGIEPSLVSAMSQMRPQDRLLVVADNCSDDTAAVVRRAGAQVIARSNPDLRGKGYALDYGVRHLAADPPDVVVILDADCVLERDALALLAGECLRLRRPIQACYLMSFPGGAGDFGSRIAQFAFLVKNRVRPLGLAQMGMPCQLLGTGMAFPWDAIRGAPLASGHIVEDMKLGADLTASGYPALFLDRARVSSVFPLSSEGTASQRKRWEHGHLQVLIGEVPRLLAAALRQRQWASLALALDLAVPPLALLAMLQLLSLLLSAGVWLGIGVVAPLSVSLAGFGALLVAVSLAWRRFGRDTISLATLAKAPLYALRKLPVYFGFVSARQTAWVRSRRDHE